MSRITDAATRHRRASHCFASLLDGRVRTRRRGCPGSQIIATIPSHKRRRLTMTSMKPEKGGSSGPSTFRWFQGMVLASTFSLVYFIAPFYMITALGAVVSSFPSMPPPAAWLYALPLLISAIIPPIKSHYVITLLGPLLDYFDYEQIFETAPIDVIQEIRNGKNYLCVCQPHGVLSFTSICSAILLPPEFQGKFPTAVADAVLYTPILKHIMGIFGLVSAKKSSMQRVLKKPGAEGSVVLYVGGVAELFLSCEMEERVYLSKRKGFIKLALTEGVDILPIYQFGNTKVLSVLKNKFLANLSRRLQVSVTYIWGKYYLPIPRDTQVSRSVRSTCLQCVV